MTLSVYGLTPIPFSDKTNIYEFVVQLITVFDSIVQ